MSHFPTKPHIFSFQGTKCGQHFRLCHDVIILVIRPNGEAFIPHQIKDYSVGILAYLAKAMGLNSSCQSTR